jgi:hypothetical protein
VHTPPLHCALYPQGDGLHGSLAGGGEAEQKNEKKLKYKKETTTYFWDKT